MILETDGSVTVNIIGSHEFFSVNHHIITVHDTITPLTFWVTIWFTSNFWVPRTVFSSVVLFGHYNTSFNFTVFNITIIIEITLVNEDSVMFGIDGIFRVDGTINFSFIISKDFESNFMNIVTFPSTWAWFTVTFTCSFYTIIRSEGYSPIVFSIYDAVMDFTEFDNIVIVRITIVLEEQ